MRKLSDVLIEKYKRGNKDVVLHGADIASQQGYTIVPNFILYTEEISGYAKLVYASLLSYAYGKKRSVYPGQSRLAENCGISRSSVKRAIKELQKKQYLTVIRRGLTKTNLYVLHLKRR